MKLREAKKKANSRDQKTKPKWKMKGKVTSEYTPAPKSSSNQSKAVARYRYGDMMIENDYLGKGKGK